LRRLRLGAELIVVATALGATVLWASLPSTARLVAENPTSTAFIDLRREQAAAAGKPFKLHWDWRPIGRISRYLRAAVIYAEDARFYTHDGVDWDAIEQAIEKNIDRGELSVGGSTITQQVAKNLYLSPSRSIIRKLRELLIAYSLEDDLSKERILELYLNIAEWGDGVFGAEAAARRWFGHSAATLTPIEAARLAVALPNPFTRAPNVHDAQLTRKVARIIRLFRIQHMISVDQEHAFLAELGVSRPAPPSPVTPATNAPSTSRPSTTPSEIVPTTDSPVQPGLPETTPAAPSTETAPPASDEPETR
jgi:monofunctional biosynthetic peptidoglycan transglycosylase